MLLAALSHTIAYDQVPWGIKVAGGRPIMAWVEAHGGRYRVRHRRAGRIVTDGTFTRRDDAVELAGRLNNATQTARLHYTPLPAPRLDDWVATWLTAHLAAESTMARYRSLLSVHILPAFGDQRIDTITRQDVKAFARELSTHLADSSVRHIITLLGQLLREAIDDHLMYFDPTARLRIRRLPHETRPFATATQVQQIAARMPDTITHTLVITAAYTGMRISELTALTRDNLHLTNATLHVCAATGALHEVDGHLLLGSPKTPAAVRDIALPPFLVDGLERLLRAHPYDTVFCTPGGRWLWRTDYNNRHWRPACDGDPRRGWQPIVPRMHIHDLRHTHRTWMDEDNIPEAAQAHRLGHAVPGIRGVYAHVTPTMTNRLLDSLQNRWLDNGGHW